MKTGEGKTLTATLAVVLNSLAVRDRDGRAGSQSIARGHPGGLPIIPGGRAEGTRRKTGRSNARACTWSRSTTTWPARRGMDEPDLRGARRVASACCRTCSPTRRSSARTPATWCTAPTRSSGFDYLRDNMAKDLAEKVQRGHSFAIVDEVDNILIDEARTPLIISGAPEQAADLYVKFARLAPRMTAGKTPEGMDPRTKKQFIADFDFEIDEKHKTVVDHRAGRRQGRALPRHRPPLPRRERAPRQPPDPGAARRGAVQAGRRLRGDRRRGEDHRRVHRAHPRRAGAGRRACTRRSRRRRGCASRRRTRRSRRSPTRTTSACTTSSPA